jgi:hypothetical protein
MVPAVGPIGRRISTGLGDRNGAVEPAWRVVRTGARRVFGVSGGVPWVVIDPVRLSRTEFEAMPIGAGALWDCRPRTLRRALIAMTDPAKPRWYAVDRQTQFGQPVYFARPITVILERQPA